MLRFIVSLFTRKPQPIVILQSNNNTRDWSEVKTACRQERFKARREKSIGIVPAILEHVDEEFRSVLMLLVACMFIAFTTTTDAMGQNLREQKVCYDAAKKYDGVLHTTVRNHYDSKTSTCWIKKVTDYTIAPVKQGDASFGSLPPMTRSEAEEFNDHFAGSYQDIIIFNAFEETSTEAYYIGAGFKMCNVNGIKCHNLEEFNTLVKTHYPGL